ncbi:amidase family protein [Streptomyces sp. AcE210]|uniref:amidase n=1 Tax=Streptomyces sp. AcE210 TaxID=2292703 RepID=UPI000E3094B4|nr:amidase family protein [Streptomyces sp. AcE210]RFC75180.1 amidase [Streptomyces sp. AcE210]
MDRAARDELCRLPATELAIRIRKLEVSPLEAVDAVLDRMADIDTTLNAYCTSVPDLARDSARRIGERLARGESVGPLAGVPVGVKDLITTRGIRTTSGSPAYEDFVPDEDDVVVERVVAAGAVVLGKTNATEFGYSAVGHNPLFPATRNPWNTRLTPGGSSAGSAAAVAAGLGPVALGSDGGGSVRVPAAHCGLVGFKAAMGRVPVWPGCRDERFAGVSGWESLEHIGPLTRTVADAALMMSVLAGPDPRDRHSIPCGDVDWTAVPADGGVAGLRVAYSADLGYLAVDPEVRRVVGEAVGVLEKDLGCRVEAVDPGWGDPAEAFAALIAADTDLTGMRHLIEEHGARMSPHLVAMMQRRWTAEEFTDANMVRKAIVNRMARLMSTYDVLVTPTTAVSAFEVGIQGPTVIDGRKVRDTAWTGFTFPVNLTGQPAVSVPAGWTRDGLPVGLHIVGRHLADAQVLSVAAAFERAAPWAHRWPTDPKVQARSGAPDSAPSSASSKWSRSATSR